MCARPRFGPPGCGSLPRLTPLLLAGSLLLSCSGGGAAGPGQAGRAGQSGSAGDGGSAAAADPPGSGSGPLTEAECMRLLDHYLELAMAEKRATLPAEQVPTAEQVARIRTAMRDQARESCIGRTERGPYDCAMRAQTTTALGSCLTQEREGGR